MLCSGYRWVHWRNHCCITINISINIFTFYIPRVAWRRHVRACSSSQESDALLFPPGKKSKQWDTTWNLYYSMELNQQSCYKPLGPLPRNILILCKVFLSENVQLELTKYCWAFTLRYSNDYTDVTLSIIQEGKIQKWNKILILD